VTGLPFHDGLICTEGVELVGRVESHPTAMGASDVGFELMDGTGGITVKQYLNTQTAGNEVFLGRLFRSFSVVDFF
jgi:hypothetical protein